MEIDKNFKDTLLKKGITEKELELKVEELKKIGSKVMPNKVDDFVKVRLNAFYRGILNKPDTKLLTGVILGYSEKEDQNETGRRLTKLAIEQNKVINGYTPKEGFFSYGFNQGTPIPDKPDYRRNILIYTEIENKPYLKNLVLSGDKDYNLKEGSKINFRLQENFDVNKETYYINELVVLDSGIDMNKLIGVVESSFSNKIKTLNECINDVTKNLVIVRGIVGLLENKGNQFKVGIYDDSLNPENGLVEFWMPNVNFSEYAIGTYFIGSFYNSKNGVGMNVLGTIVPECDRKVEIEDDVVEEVANDVFDDEDSIINDDVEDLL